MTSPFKDHIWNMGLALEEAEAAYRIGEVPVGAVVVDKDGRILSRAHNLKETTHDPCGHAEILALRQAATKAGNWRLTGAVLYVTLEPCAMCLGAMVHARIDTLAFGAYDPKAGALSLGHHLHRDPRLNHRFSVVGGIRHYECSKVLSVFFKERRAGFST